MPERGCGGLTGLLMACALAACTPMTDYSRFQREPVQPMPALVYSGVPPAPAAHAGRRLLVLLPPIGNGMADFDRHGWVRSARQHFADLDVVAVDAHYGYYAEKQLPRRLYADILVPARAHYREVWLAGVSLGGYGALLTLQAYPDAVDGVILLSPYLGEQAVVDAIRRQDWQHWQPRAGQDDDALWHWLHGSAPLERIWLGYARHERFAGKHALLAGLLPAGQVQRVHGLHAWCSWDRLWPRLLPALRLP